MRLFLLLTAVLSAISILPPDACAGAWTLAPGDGQAIVSSGRRTAPISAIWGGPAAEDTNDLRVYVEYGVFEDVTIGASASGEWSPLTNEVDLRLGAHARYRIWQSDSGGVYSIQAGASVPVTDWVGLPRGAGSPGAVPEAEIRLLYGRSWLGEWGNTFLNAELAYRWRRGDVTDELRLDWTVGHSVSRRFMGIFSAYATLPLGGGDPTLTLSPSVAWTLLPSLGPNDKKPADLAPPRTIQFAISYDVLNPDDGLGFTLSIWNRF